MKMDLFNIISVTSKNVNTYGVYCIKEKEAEGSQAKINWCKLNDNKYLQIKIAIDKRGKQVGFIEYTAAEYAWRPVDANNYLFIHCIGIFVKEARNVNLGTTLIKACEHEAKQQDKSGVCVMTSEGAFMVNKKLFLKNGYKKVDALDRFELMVKKYDDKSPSPKLIDWTKQLKKYKGWNLVYSDQCPWNIKSVNDLRETALEYGIDLKIKKIKNSAEAKKTPSGFGVYSLIKDGILLGDHYLSKTRFKSILAKELSNK